MSSENHDPVVEVSLPVELRHRVAVDADNRGVDPSVVVVEILAAHFTALDLADLDSA